MLCASLKEQRVLWRYHPERAHPFYSSAALVGGRIVLGGRDRRVHCLDTSTGRAIWTYATRGRVESSPAIAGTRVYVGSTDGRLYVFDITSGAKLREWNAGGPLSASPAIAGGRLVIGSQDGQLFCLGGR